MLEENYIDFIRLNHEHPLDEAQKKQFLKYIELLEKWSRKINLTSRGDINKIVAKHITESLLYNTADIQNKTNIVDLGSGAGFPGIPLKIMHPQKRMILLESRRLKAEFLQRIVDALELGNISVLCQRIENLSPDQFGTIDVITARAVGPLYKLWTWTRPLLTVGGVLVVIKGGDIWSEIEKIKKSFYDFDAQTKNTGYISTSHNQLYEIKLIKKLGK